jgi:hypothetical protein
MGICNLLNKEKFTLYIHLGWELIHEHINFSIFLSKFQFFYSNFNHFLSQLKNDIANQQILSV